MKKFLITLGVLTAIATPAFAQAFDPESGTGNVLPFSHKSIQTDDKTAFRQDALRAYATVPFEGSVANSSASAACGCGSAGYNEMLRNY